MRPLIALHFAMNTIETARRDVVWAHRKGEATKRAPNHADILKSAYLQHQTHGARFATLDDFPIDLK